MIAMQSKSDCGPVALANLLEACGKGSADELYLRIKKEWAFPDKQDFRDDLWDSPWRHFLIAESISGQKAGLMPMPLLTASVVLLRLTRTTWHWVFVKGYTHGAVVWHDGHRERADTLTKAFPGCEFVLAYGLGERQPLAHWWYYWYLFTQLLLRF